MTRHHSKKSFKLTKVIGQGGFGTVLEGVVNNETVIIKCVDIDAGDKEIHFLEKLSNAPGIVQYITHFSDQNYTYIVMRKIDNVVDLFTFMSSKEILSEPIAQIIVKQLVNILYYCKQKCILHNDIKDTNILINPNTLQITLIDFGAAEAWQNNCYYYKYKGTEYYSCPEWRHHRKYSANGMTSWSIGMLIYIMFFGEIPFDELFDFNEDKICLNDISHLSQNAITFLSRCLTSDPVSQITLDEMLCHAWIKTIFTEE